ncbi:MAG: glycosyltransferase family 4 protein [Spirochaetes bacterium]|nr:glycosyltransferase family 4 protein [Spirochaetota bacterium]
MKICLLCYRGNPYSGGQGIYLKYVAEELLKQGHEVHVITGPPYPFLDKSIIVHKIHNNEYFVKKGNAFINMNSRLDILQPVNFYEYFSSRFGVFPEIKSFSIRAYFKLRELSRKHKFDVIHDNQCLGYGLLLMRTLGIPVIATIHHPLTIDRDTLISRSVSIKNAFKTIMFYPVLMQRIVAKRLDHIITVSENSMISNNHYLSLPLEKQTVIFNGIDTDIFRPLDSVKKKKGKIIFVGNAADSKKGFSYLIKAMKSVNDGIKLTVVDGISLNNKGITRFINKMGVSDKIEFTGTASTEELVRHYNEAEIAVVPSIHEGFGFPAAEAMACGTPVIASDGGALPEITGDAGITVPARDSEKLAEAINSLYSNKKAMHEMRDKGLIRVKNHFTWEPAVRRMTEVYMRCKSNL